jgi:AcrR family transcriptional regulator
MSSPSVSAAKEFAAKASSEATCSSVKLSARDRIFAAARDLFYRQGIRAVGVESIAQEAGATKMSLYRAFPSKDELVAECLKQSERDFFVWWDETIAPHANNPEAAVLALFKGMSAKAGTCEKRGCVIGNASVEITDEDHPGRAVVEAYSREKRRRLRELCAAMKARDPEELADGLMLLMDGGYFSRLSLGPKGPTASLSKAAQALMRAYTA